MKYTQYIVAVAAIGALIATPVAAQTGLGLETSAKIDASTTVGGPRMMKPQIRMEGKGEARADMKEDLDMKRGMVREARGNLITAVVTRINATADVMTTFGTKLEARITAAKAHGVDVTAWSAIYADYTLKLADAKLQAKAAADIAATIKTDGTVKETMEINKKIAMDARAKIKLARTSLHAARADADKLVKAFRANAKSDVKADTTATIETQ